MLVGEIDGDGGRHGFGGGGVERGCFFRGVQEVFKVLAQDGAVRVAGGEGDHRKG